MALTRGEIRKIVEEEEIRKLIREGRWEDDPRSKRGETSTWDYWVDQPFRVMIDLGGFLLLAVSLFTFAAVIHEYVFAPEGAEMTTFRMMFLENWKAIGLLLVMGCQLRVLARMDWDLPT